MKCYVSDVENHIGMVLRSQFKYIALHCFKEKMLSYEHRDYSFYFNPDIDGLATASHLHREVEMLYLLEGSMEVALNATTYRLEKGDLFIAFPNVAHEYLNAQNSRCMLWIFDSGILGDFVGEIKRKALNNPVIKASEIHADINYAIYSFRLLGTLYESNHLSRAYLSLIMAHVINDHNTVDIKDDYSEWLSKLLYYINEHFCEHISLDMLSTQVGVSRYHLSRTFASKMNCNVTTYINNLRVQKAVELIRYSDKALTEIAFECGFESMPTFFRSFKKSGIASPKTLRSGIKS